MSYCKRHIQYVIAVALAFFILQLAFVNCVVLTDEGFQTSSSHGSGYSKGNGNGYVGIDAPTEVRAGSKFMATAYGGAGSYKFYMIEGKATITPIVNAIVEVQVSADNASGSIELGVTDAVGNSGSARITLLPSDPKGFVTTEPTGSSISSMLVSPDGTMVFKNNGTKSILTSADNGEVLLDIESILGPEIYKTMNFQKFSEDSEWLIYHNGQSRISPWTYPTRIYLIKRDGSEVKKIIEPEKSFCKSTYPLFDVHIATNKIVYFCALPTAGVFVMNFDGSERTQLGPVFLPTGVYNTNNYYGFGEVLFSPNGEYVAYSGYAQNKVTKELYLGHLDGSNFKKLNDLTIANHYVSNVRFSPDSSYLLYVSDEEVLKQYQLYRVNSDHSSRVKLSENSPWVNHTFQYIDITSDSERVAYVYGSSNNPKYNLYSNHRDGGQQKLLSQSEYNVPGSPRPVITSDSQSIVFLQQDPKSNDFCYLKSNRLTGGALRSLSYGQLGSYSPQAVIQFDVLPSTNQVVYISKEEAPGQGQLYKIQLNGQSRIKLSPQPMPDFSDIKKFVIAPDNSRIIYSADLAVDGQLELYSVQPNGENRVKLSPPLASSQSDAYDVNWFTTPDSKYLLFQADALYDNRYEYYRSTLNGGQILLTSPVFVAPNEIFKNSQEWGKFIDPINYAFISSGHDFYGSAYRPFIYNTETQKRHSLSPNWDDNQINSNLRMRNVDPLNKILIYADTFMGGNNLWMMNKDGAAFVDLFNTSNYEGFTRPKYRCFKLSDDAQYIAYAGELYSYFSTDLVITKTDGSQVKRLTTGFGNSHDGVATSTDCEVNFLIAPNNSRLVYIADHSFWERELWSVKLDGTDRKRISQDLDNPDQGSLSPTSDPAIRKIIGFTPDAKWVFYYGNPKMPNENHLYAVSPEGGPVYQLTEAPNSFLSWYATEIFVTKDSSTIVYRAMINGIMQIVASNPNGENKRILNGDLTSGHVSEGDLLSDKETLVYVANGAPDGSRGIFKIRVDGTDLKKLSGVLDVHRKVISDDEKFILYIQKESENPKDRTIWQVTIDGTNRKLIQTPLVGDMELEYVQYAPGTANRKIIYVAYDATDLTRHYYLYDQVLDRQEKIWLGKDYSYFSGQLVYTTLAFYKDGFAMLYNATVQFIKFPF